MSLLEVIELSCGYDNKDIITDISFKISEADFIGIIGPNGAGKTTFFRVITGLIKPSRGKILYDKIDIQKIKPYYLAKEIAVLPQILEVPLSFTVKEFVLIGRFPHLKRFQRIRDIDMKKVEEAMLLTDVIKFEKRKINELSGGERQRVLIAQALAQEPKLLLLDEPTTHLDIGHQIEIFDLIKKLNKEKKLTVVSVLQDLNLAGEYCKQLILLHNGKIYKSGNPSEVLTYDIIESVYKTIVIVKENPVSGKPHVLIVPYEERIKKGGE